MRDLTHAVYIFHATNITFSKTNWKIILKWSSTAFSIPGATYHFRLAAVYSNSDNRHGPNSERFLVEAPDKSKPPAFGPIIVELKAVSPNALSVSWQVGEAFLPELTLGLSLM